MPLPFRLRAYAVPALLLAIAGLQAVLVRTHDLTPWKGGGFGMFSTYDRMEARALHVILETAAGEAHALRPRVTDPKARVLNMPSEGVLRAAAAHALDADWRVFTPAEFEALRLHLPPAYQRQIDCAAHPPGMLLAIRAGEVPEGLEGHPAHLRAARAVVWRQQYDPTSHLITAAPVASVRVPLP